MDIRGNIVKFKIKMINRGLILLLILIIGAGIYCAVDVAAQISREKEVRSNVETFYKGMESLLVWPDGMPEEDMETVFTNEEKYYHYLDKGFEKVKPYLYDNDTVRIEVKDGALAFLNKFLDEGCKPSDVSITPKIEEIKVTRNYASVLTKLSLNIRGSDNTNLVKNFEGLINYECVEGKWVIVYQCMYES